MLGQIAMSLLGGSTLGATLMYLLDPDQGQNHRRALKQSAQPAVTNLRAHLADHLATASRAIAPQQDDRPISDLTPTQAYTALSLTRHARELPCDTRDTYARARDLYYNALIDLDLARHPRPAPKPIIKKTYAKRPTPDYLAISLVAAGCCAAGAAAMFLVNPTAARRRPLIRGRAQGQLPRANSPFRQQLITP